MTPTHPWRQNSPYDNLRQRIMRLVATQTTCTPERVMALYTRGISAQTKQRALTSLLADGSLTLKEGMLRVKQPSGN